MTTHHDAKHSARRDPYRAHVWGIAFLFLTLPVLMAVLGRSLPRGRQGPPPIELAVSAVVKEAGGIEQLVASDLFAQGREEFIMNCTSCHGEHGEAKPGLGRDIMHSKFVAERTDDELIGYIKVGRRSNDPLNTTGVDMPPKGGNPALNEAQMRLIVVYIRALQAAARGEVELPDSNGG